MTLQFNALEEILQGLFDRIAALETALGVAIASPLAVEFVTSEQACQILQVSRPTLLKLRRSGKITATEVGCHPRYSLASLRAYLASRQVTGETIAALVGRASR